MKTHWFFLPLAALFLFPTPALGQEEAGPNVNEMLKTTKDYYQQQMEVYKELGLADDQAQVDRSIEQLKQTDTDKMVESYKKAFDDQQSEEWVEVPPPPPQP